MVIHEPGMPPMSSAIESSYNFGDYDELPTPTPEPNQSRHLGRKITAWALVFGLGAGGSVAAGYSLKGWLDHRYDAAKALNVEATTNTTAAVALMVGRMGITSVTPADIHIANGGAAASVTLPGYGDFAGKPAHCTIDFPVIMHDLEPVGLAADQSFNGPRQLTPLTTHAAVMQAEQNHCPNPR